MKLIMKKLFLPILTLIIISSALNSCKDDESIIEVKSIYGSWVREITDPEGVTFTGQMTFKTDNTFDFTILTAAPGHNNSTGKFTLTTEQITFVEDIDCGTDGTYDYVVGDNSIALIAATETCDPRKGVLQSVWRKK
jgi:hypothetical protein